MFVNIKIYYIRKIPGVKVPRIEVLNRTVRNRDEMFRRARKFQYVFR